MDIRVFETVTDDDMVSQSSRPPTGGAQAGSGETMFVSAEVAGDIPVPPSVSDGESGLGDAAVDTEVENPVGTEAGEESVEATRDQLGAEAGEESAFGDLQGIEGFEAPKSEESAQSGDDQELAEVGSAMAGASSESDPEFAFLAALIPTLISAVGPSIAKAVAGRLKPATRKRMAQHATNSRGSGGGKKAQILALISKLLESAESMPAGESAGEVQPEVVETAVAAMESIIGSDDRIRITATSAIPWRRICALRIAFPSGNTYRGTGFFIGPRTLATAGHCVYLKKEGGWAKRIEVTPGMNGTTKPFGQAVSTQFRSVAGWVAQGRAASDYGCVVLPQGAFNGRNLGAFGFAAWSATNLLAAPAVVAGYPGDKPFAQMWGMARKIKTVTSDQVQYEIDTMGGQSGAPVYIKRNGQRYCVAIHNYGGSAVNSATRITETVYRRLSGWSRL